MLLLGQAFEAAAYHRRFNALSSVMKDYRKLKETLKEKADLLLGEHRMLFGDKFQNYITETVKISQKSEELFKLLNKGKSQPFRQVLYRKKPVVGGVKLFFREGQVLQPVLPEKTFQVKAHQKSKLFSNMLPELIPLNQGKIHSVVKGLFSPETLPKVMLTGSSQHSLWN